MSIRKTLLVLFLYLAVVLGVGAGKAAAQAISVKLQLFPFTGEVRLLNDNPDPFSFTFYSLKSPSGALNGSNGVWTSISDTYDLSGNGFISTSIDEWIKLSSGPTELAEAAFTGTVGTLPAYRSVSLGRIWDPNKVPTTDLVAQILLPSGSDAMVSIDDQAIDGNYFAGDHVVDETDYAIWNFYFGSTTAYFADGNINGIVDAADYTVWRDNLGRSLAGTGDGSLANAGRSGGGAAAAVPEPASALLSLFAGASFLLPRRRRSWRGTIGSI